MSKLAKKTKSKGCQFIVSWVGRCGEGTNKYCPKHRKEKCGTCKKQATRDCDATIGPMVCGFPLCGTCGHSHGGLGWW